MDTKTAIKKVTSMEYVIVDIFNQAEIYHLSHEQLLDLMKEKLFGYPGYNDLPAWAKSRLDGFWNAMQHNLYRYQLHWRLKFRDQYLSREEVPEGGWIEVSGGGYFYNDAPDRRFDSDDSDDQ